jgi:2-phosphosulfolactate phosphatase
MKNTVVIDCFPESARRYREGYAIVAVDVIRATTSAITIAATGRKCFTAASLVDAMDLARQFENPLLVGELGGDMPAGFDMNNSPADLLERNDLDRPVVLLSTSGTRLIHEGRDSDAIYLACFRNFEATAGFLAGRHQKIAVIGAGSRGEFREEDQMCCAWVADLLMQSGYAAENLLTVEVIERWRGTPPAACVNGNSANYLRRSGQHRDLDFILSHVSDLDSAFMMRDNEVIRAGFKQPQTLEHRALAISPSYSA